MNHNIIHKIIHCMYICCFKNCTNLIKYPKRKISNNGELYLNVKNTLVCHFVCKHK